MPTPKVGLALGAGAFRGLAHIGLLDALEKHHIPIDMIAGTSIGSLVGAAYASGMTPGEMEEYAVTLKETQYYDIGIPRQGLLAGKRLQTMVEELTEGKTFADTRIPLRICACDFESMEAVVIDEGPLHEAVRASVSIPVVFVPFPWHDRLLVDGGVLGRVPTAECRAMGADIVIGVDVGYRGQYVAAGGFIDNMIHTFDMLEWQIARQLTSDADLLIAPDVVDINPARIGNRAEECIQRGRAAAEEAIESIRTLIARATEEGNPA
ncbi:MAG: patatin-like phospholipase family protein [Oscillospiraceae bacterium]|nr:patatin-like phospholipase family protein [Oscillospiraceae bacterium]